MSKGQTDNSHLQAKIDLRMESIKALGVESIRVLELYGGDGIIWRTIQQQNPHLSITTHRIDKKKDRAGAYLVGDNQRWLSSLNLQSYDIIDIDAYGTPYAQLQQVLESGYRGIVHLTWIRSKLNANKKLLADYGVTNAMYRKATELCGTLAEKALFAYIARFGVQRAYVRRFEQWHRKYYMWFAVTQEKQR